MNWLDLKLIPVGFNWLDLKLIPRLLEVLDFLKIFVNFVKSVSHKSDAFNSNSIQQNDSSAEKSAKIKWNFWVG